MRCTTSWPRRSCRETQRGVRRRMRPRPARDFVGKSTAIRVCVGVARPRPRPAPPRPRVRDGPGHLPPLRPGQGARRPPSTSIASNARHPRGRSSPGWPSSARSACRSRPSTAGSPRAARASTWRWWSRPRSSLGPRSECGRLADHPARDPHPRLAARRRPRSRSRSGYRGVASGGGHEQRSRSPNQTSDPTVARSRRPRRRPSTAPDYVDQRRQDVVHLRRTRRRAHAPRRTDPDRSKAHRGLSLFIVSQTDAATAMASRSTQDGTGGSHGGPGHRHDRLPRHALLRGCARRLASSRRRTSSAVTTVSGSGFYLHGAGLRERPAPDRGACASASCRPHTRRLSTMRATASCSGSPLIDYELSQVKLGRMVAIIQSTRPVHVSRSRD